MRLQPPGGFSAQIGQQRHQGEFGLKAIVDDSAQVAQAVTQQIILAAYLRAVQRAEKLRADVVMHIAADPVAFQSGTAFIGATAFGSQIVGLHGIGCYLNIFG